MTVVLDAGALIALDRGDRGVAADLVVARRQGADVVTIGPVIGQVWRDGARQVGLARAVATVEVLPVGAAEGRAAGELLGRSGTADVVDALLALAVRPGDQVITSDSDDLRRLLLAAGVRARVVPV